MRKIRLSVAAVLIAGTSLVFTSCIGSFGLTNKVISWNRNIAFWILPVYEVTALADVLVINSIEFWSGTNPLTASVKTVDTDHGRYMIACDGKGYTVTNETTGEEVRLNFDETEQTWSVGLADGEELPFMTFVDTSHVRMLTPGGDYLSVELSESGLMAYEAAAGMLPMASK